MSRQSTHIVSKQLKARLFSILHQSEISGLTIHHVISLLIEQKIIPRSNIIQFKNSIAHGNTVADAGATALLFSPFEYSLISVGESSGQLAQIYHSLALLYKRQIALRSHLKSKLTLPIITLIVFIFLQPIQALILGQLSIGSYLLNTFGVIAKTLLGIYLVTSLPKWLTTPFSHTKGLAREFYRLQGATPLLSNWVKQRAINHFLTAMSLQINAGINIEAALINSITTLQNPLLRQQMHLAIDAVQQGKSLTVALQTTQLFDELTLQHINVAEQSGRLERVLTHLSQINNNAVAEHDKLLFEWLPRLIYGVIVVTVAYSLISGASILSV
jgi:general secretion pathway protein F